jgi:hypothetical protein
MLLLPRGHQVFLGLLVLDSCCASIEWHRTLKWSAGISRHLSTPLSNAKHLEQKSRIQFTRYVTVQCTFAVATIYVYGHFWVPSNSGRLRRCGSHRKRSEQHTNAGFFEVKKEI